MIEISSDKDMFILLFSSHLNLNVEDIIFGCHSIHRTQKMDSVFHFVYIFSIIHDNTS